MVKEISKTALNIFPLKVADYLLFHYFYATKISIPELKFTRIKFKITVCKKDVTF